MKKVKGFCGVVLCAGLAALILGGGIFYARRVTAYRETPIKPLETQRLSVFNEIEDKEGFRLCARRGLSAKAPENTLEAIRLAGEAGFRYVQLDVAQTRDGEPVLLFDETVNRMTAQRGALARFTAEQVSDLVLDNGANVEKYTNVYIPQLQSALRECAEYGMTAYLTVRSLRAPEKLYAVLENSPVPYVLFSARKRVLSVLKQRGEAQLCYQVRAVTRENLRYALENDFALTFDPELAENTDEVLTAAVKCVTLYAWTVNSREELRRMEKLGIRDVLTDRIIPVRSTQK